MTEIGININPKKNIGEANYHLIIPKCLAEYLDEIEFDTKDYTVIKEDPIIAWHFAEMDRQANMNYRVKGRIDKNCLEDIKGMAIADMIDYKEPNPVVPIIIISLIGIAVLATVWMEIKFQKNPPTTSSNQIVSEQESEQQMVDGFKQQWLKSIKQQGLNREKANKYMRDLNVPEDIIDYVLKKI